MRKSIATVSVSGTLEEKLTAIARAGFDGVEVFENDLLGCRASPAEVGRRAADLGLTVELYQPFRDFEAVPQDVFARNLRRAERKLDVMEQLGVRTLLVCSNVSDATVDDDDLAASQLSVLADHASLRGMRVAYEALAWGRHVNDYRRAWSIVDAADHPHLGLCLDSFHILSRGHDTSTIADIPGPRVFFCQVADAPRLVMDVLQWSRHYRCFPGQGAFDLTTFLQHLVACGYSGPLSLEVFSDVFRHAESGRTAEDGLRSLLFLEESVRSQLERTSGPQLSSVRERFELFDPPASPALPGYAFVELGTGPQSARSARRQLETLGFGHVGSHRSKDVELWRHGDVAVVLNRQPEGTRLLPDPERLPGVVALGLESADPVASANRAAAFRARARPRRLGRGEADMPTVETPDGLALLFCPASAPDRRDWLDDFGPLADPPPGTLTGVDHVALSVEPDRLEEAVLFLRSVLGLSPREPHELADPYGLVNSRAMQDDEGRVRLVLNAATLGGTRRAGAHDACQPAYGMQHVAFASDDIVATLRALRRRGLTMLPIPGNYYDDLAARSDLSDERIGVLCELNVLHDSDAQGEYLHAFSHTVGERLFFEIVERVGGYAGYGARNAFVRLAAQRHSAEQCPPDS